MVSFYSPAHAGLMVNRRLTITLPTGRQAFSIFYFLNIYLPEADYRQPGMIIHYLYAIKKAAVYAAFLLNNFENKYP